MRRPAPGKRPTHNLDEAALVQQLAGALPHASAAGRARATEWLANIARTASGKALKALIDRHPALTNLLDGIAEAAPYLWDLVRDDPARLLRLLSRNPE